MKKNYRVYAMTNSSCADGKHPQLGTFTSFKKARKCVAENSIYSFIVIDAGDNGAGDHWYFFRNRRI